MGAQTPSSRGDAVTLRRRQATCYVNIHSERGIGSTPLVLPTWPGIAAVVLRLHLRGLEGLTLDLGDRIIQISVSSSPPHQTSQTVATRDAGPPVALEPTDADWSDVIRVSQPGGATAKRFDIWLAETLCARDPLVCAVRWVDFYR